MTTRRSPQAIWTGGPPHPVDRTPGAYPPGAPPGAPPPRLPSLGGMRPYDPPAPVGAPPQPVPLLGEADSYESRTVQWQFEGNVRASLYTTRRRWRAIDVYLDFSSIQVASRAGACFSVLVYALGQQSRTLVASGRAGRWPLGTNLALPPPVWICGARAVAERYEVEAWYSDSGPLPLLSATVPVTVIASDEMVEVPERVGVVPLSDTGAVNTILSSATPIQAIPYPEVVGVSGTNGAGGTAAAPVPRWLQMFDQALPLAPGTAPTIEWPLGSVDGDGVVDREIRYRGAFNELGAVHFRASSTPGTLTAVFDCPMQVLIR